VLSIGFGRKPKESTLFSLWYSTWLSFKPLLADSPFKRFISFLHFGSRSPYQCCLSTHRSKLSPRCKILSLRLGGRSLCRCCLSTHRSELSPRYKLLCLCLGSRSLCWYCLSTDWNKLSIHCTTLSNNVDPILLKIIMNSQRWSNI
jgi:hypothetical protein